MEYTEPQMAGAFWRISRFFFLFAGLERAVRMPSLDKVMHVVGRIETCLDQIGKRQRVVLAHMYLYLSHLTCRQAEAEETLPHGRFRQVHILARPISDEERLIGFWAQVNYTRFVDHLLRQVYANSPDGELSPVARNVARRPSGAAITRPIHRCTYKPR